MHEPAYEGLPEPVKEQINELYHQAQQQPKQAIAILLPLIEQYPDLPKLYNFLHVAYQVLGDRANARRIVEETIERFPDYLFGRIGYANDCLERGELDKVSEIFEGKFELKLLYPEREVFHLSEVMNFNTLVARYYLAKGDRTQAEIRYKLLRQLDPEHPHTRLVGQLLAQSLRLEPGRATGVV
jgi:tetratricopeptide (TPR) repeat protein